jgi:hypothetical protein
MDDGDRSGRSGRRDWSGCGAVVPVYDAGRAVREFTMGKQTDNRYGFGVILITIGVLFLIDRQGLYGFGQLWPVILLVIGTFQMVVPGDDGRRNFGGLWLLLVGGIFLMHNFHVLRISQSWPLFIVAGGLAVMFGGTSCDARKEIEEKAARKNMENPL